MRKSVLEEHLHEGPLQFGAFEEFQISLRGVQQGSVLVPLFYLIIFCSVLIYYSGNIMG